MKFHKYLKFKGVLWIWGKVGLRYPVVLHKINVSCGCRLHQHSNQKERQSKQPDFAYAYECLNKQPSRTNAGVQRHPDCSIHLGWPLSLTRCAILMTFMLVFHIRYKWFIVVLRPVWITAIIGIFWFFMRQSSLLGHWNRFRWIPYAFKLTLKGFSNNWAKGLLCLK